MRTEKQIEASRLNGAKSRGAFTPEGKRNSARYRTRNANIAESVALKTENVNEFRDLLNDLCAQYQPATCFERVLVESMGIAIWKQLRYRTASKVAVDLQTDIEARNLPPYDHVAAAALGCTIRKMADTGRSLEMLERQDRLLSRQYENSSKLLVKIQERRKLDPEHSGPVAAEPSATDPEAASDQQETSEQPEIPTGLGEPTAAPGFVSLRNDYSPVPDGVGSAAGAFIPGNEAVTPQEETAIFTPDPNNLLKTNESPWVQHSEPEPEPLVANAAAGAAVAPETAKAAAPAYSAPDARDLYCSPRSYTPASPAVPPSSSARSEAASASTASYTSSDRPP
jgi:hypothetical protein